MQLYWTIWSTAMTGRSGHQEGGRVGNGRGGAHADTDRDAGCLRLGAPPAGCPPGIAQRLTCKQASLTIQPDVINACCSVHHLWYIIVASQPASVRAA